MKQLYIFWIFALAAMMFCFSACKDDDMEVITHIVEIDAEAGEYYGQYPILKEGDPLPPSEPGMFMRTDDYDGWYIYPQNLIEGFIFEEGYYCKLLINIYRSKNSDMISGGRKYGKYKLKEVLEKKQSASLRNK